MGKHEPADHLAWRKISVGGRRVNYGVAGHGLPVLFVHGWGLGSHAYKRDLKRLVRMGCRVYAPALPEFGGSAGLSGRRCDLPGYADWAAAFLDAVGVDEPVLAIGHSFGGAVVTQLAHDFSDRVSHLVLINSIGGGVWSSTGAKERTLKERPIWDWAVNFPRDMALDLKVVPMLSAILGDAVPNFLTNPLGLYRAGMLARQVDLRVELGDLKASGMPVWVLWGEGDTIVPRASYEATCTASGGTGHLVPGRHSWLLADPEAFAGVMVRAVSSAMAARSARAGLARRRWLAREAQLPSAAAG